MGASWATPRFGTARGAIIRAGEPGRLVGAAKDLARVPPIESSATVISLVALRTGSRREALQTNLWLVPTVEVVAALALYFAAHGAGLGGHHPGPSTTTD